MAKTIEKFLITETFSLLLWLSEHQSTTRYGPVVKFSQEELSKELQCSPTSVNKRMKELYELGCIEKPQKRGNYRITKSGKEVITEMKKIETILTANQ